MVSFKNLAMCGALALGALAMAAPARAAIVIDFSTGLSGTGGTFELLSGGNAAGFNIPIGAVSISGAPLNDNVFAVTGGVLDFNTSGSSVSCGASCTIAANSIAIVGSISGLSISTETLLSGSFTSFTADNNGLHNATGPDAKATNLLTALGLPTNTPFALFGFSTTTNGAAVVGGATDTVISTDIRNTAVPEPTSLLMLGTGLLGLGSIVRRRLAR